MTDPYEAALELAGELLGKPLELPLGPGEPDSGHEFRRLATLHTFGDSWTRTPDRSRRVRGAELINSRLVAFGDADRRRQRGPASCRHRHRELCDGGPSKALVSFRAYACLLLGGSVRPVRPSRTLG